MSDQHQCITEEDITFLEGAAPDYGTPDGLQDADEKRFYRLCDQIATCKTCRDTHLTYHRLHL